MNFKTEDFPTPVSPTRRMVCGVSVDALIVPFLRDSVSLRNTVRRCRLKDVVTYLTFEDAVFDLVELNQ